MQHVSPGGGGLGDILEFYWPFSPPQHPAWRVKQEGESTPSAPIHRHTHTLTYTHTCACAHRWCLTHLHGVVQLLVLPLLLHPLLLLLQELLGLEVPRGSMLHGVVCVFRVCLGGRTGIRQLLCLWALKASAEQWLAACNTFFPCFMTINTDSFFFLSYCFSEYSSFFPVLLSPVTESLNSLAWIFRSFSTCPLSLCWPLPSTCLQISFWVSAQIFFLMFWPHSSTCKIFVSWPRNEPMLCAAGSADS